MGVLLVFGNGGRKNSAANLIQNGLKIELLKAHISMYACIFIRAETKLLYMWLEFRLNSWNYIYMCDMIAVRRYMCQCTLVSCVCFLCERGVVFTQSPMVLIAQATLCFLSISLIVIHIVLVLRFLCQACASTPSERISSRMLMLFSHASAF